MGISVSIYQTSLFLYNGRYLTFKNDSMYLAQFFYNHCNTAIGFNHWSQTFSFINQKFIDNHWLTGSHHSDLNIGHFTAVSRHHYIKNHNTPEFAILDVLYKQS